MTKHWILAACLTTGLGAQAQEPPDGMPLAVRNPSFEGEYLPLPAVQEGAKAQITGAIAPGWEDNSNWGDFAVDYGPETADPHRGTTAQRVTVIRNGVQFVQSAHLQKGRVYRFSVWLRGQPGQVVTLMLRRRGAPYTTYVSDAAVLSAEWRQFEIAGPVPEDADAYLMLIAGGVMRFYVDDAILTDLTDAEAGPPRAGNLLPGGNFEAGVSYGWSVRSEGSLEHAFADQRPMIDTTAAAVGRQSLRFDIPDGANAQIQSPIFTYNFNRAHTASFWLKASAPNTSLYVEFRGTGKGSGFAVGPQWQRFHMTHILPFRRYTYLYVHCQTGKGEGRSLWIDGAQVEEASGPAPDYMPTAPHDVSLGLQHPGHVVFDDEDADIDLSIAPPPPANSHLELSVVDIHGMPRELNPSIVPWPAAHVRLPDFADLSRGVFRLQARLIGADGQALSTPVDLVWARLPRPRDIEPTQSFFGNHIPLAPDYIAIALATGTRWVRLHDTSAIAKWPAAEASPGQWTYYDEGVTAAKEAGLAILGMLDGAPGWVSSKPREGYFAGWHIPDQPGWLDHWRTYVRQVVGHYKGRIDHWEMWNEPWGNWWVDAGVTPEQYAQMLQEAYRVAKEVNPACVIVGVDTCRGQEKWTDDVLRCAGTDAYDAFSFHDYNDTLYGGPVTVPTELSAILRKAQEKAGTPKPTWNTEGGLFAVGSFYTPLTGGMPAELQLSYIVRYDVCYMAEGVHNFFLYGIHSDPAMGQVECRTIEHDRAIRPILAARAVLASLVDGAGVPVRHEPVEGVDQYTFPARAGEQVSVLWSYAGENRVVPVPPATVVLDIFGNPLPPGATLQLGYEPRYLVMRLGN